MEEQTNLTAAESVTENLFLDESDIVEESDELVDSTAEVEQAQDTEAETTEASAPKTEEIPETASATGIKVKYNGEEREVSNEDIPTYVQKGMNYDHVKEELDRYRAREKELSALDEIAKANGMTAGEYLNKIGTALREAKITELTDKGMSREEAVELIQLREMRASAERNKQTVDTAEQRKEAFKQFFKDNPSVTSLPNEVLKEVANGKDLNSAWNDYQRDAEIKQLKEDNAKLKKQAEISAQNEKNIASATPSAETKSRDEEDTFLMGLFG
jgi:uncharacterized protein YoaH (UPF0181 family)